MRRTSLLTFPGWTKMELLLFFSDGGSKVLVQSECKSWKRLDQNEDWSLSVCLSHPQSSELYWRLINKVMCHLEQPGRSLVWCSYNESLVDWDIVLILRISFSDPPTDFPMNKTANPHSFIRSTASNHTKWANKSPQTKRIPLRICHIRCARSRSE